MTNMFKKLIMIGFSILSFNVYASNLEIHEMTGYKLKDLESVENFTGYLPFKVMTLEDSDLSFVAVMATYQINWENQEDERERFELTFESLKLKGVKEYLPIGKLSHDFRLEFEDDPSRVQLRADERWGNDKLYLGALFVVDDSEKEFIVTFNGIETKLKDLKESKPTANEFSRIEVLDVQLINEFDNKDSSLEKKIPGAKSKFTTEVGKFLIVKVNLYSLKVNQLGADGRYNFKPSDFSLINAGQYVKPLGFIGKYGGFGVSSIYNTYADGGETASELSLVFLVEDDFEAGTLLFRNVKVQAIMKSN